jgi:hypothetical protein
LLRACACERLTAIASVCSTRVSFHTQRPDLLDLDQLSLSHCFDDTVVHTMILDCGFAILSSVSQAIFDVFRKLGFPPNHTVIDHPFDFPYLNHISTPLR